MTNSLSVDSLQTVSSSSFCDTPDFTQVYADEFTGETLDEKSWALDLEGGDSRVRESQGLAENVYLKDGNLILKTQKVETPINGYNYTSGAIQSQGLKSFQGKTRVCIMAKLPGDDGGGKGIWPAHWLMVSSINCECLTIGY